MESPTDYTCMCCDGSIFFNLGQLWIGNAEQGSNAAGQRKNIILPAYSGIVTAPVAP